MSIQRTIAAAFLLLTSSFAQAAFELPHGRYLEPQETVGQNIIAVLIGLAADVNVPSQPGGTSEAARSGERVTVLVDGVLMELPYWVVVGLIRDGTFIVISGWNADLVWDVGEIDCEEQPRHPLCPPVIK